MSYSSWLPSIMPTPLQGPNATEFFEEHGEAIDDVASDARAAVKARFPEEAPADALGKIGADRSLEAAAGETDASYAARLKGAWDAWPLAGKALGILNQLWDAGYTFTNGKPILVQQNGRAIYLDAAKAPTVVELGLNPAIGGIRPIAVNTVPWWTFDNHLDANNDQYNSRFGLIFGNTSIVTTPGTGVPWDNVATPLDATTRPTLAEVDRIRRIVNTFRPAKAKFMWIAAVVSGWVWGWDPATSAPPVWGAVGLVWGGTVVQWSSVEGSTT